MSTTYPDKDEARAALLNGEDGPFKFEVTYEYTNPVPEGLGPRDRMSRPAGKSAWAAVVAGSRAEAKSKLHDRAAEYGREIEITWTTVAGWP